MTWGPLPPYKGGTPDRGGTFIDIEVVGGITVGGDIISDTWDGTVPLNLNSKDTGATTGYGLDGSAGNIQAFIIFSEAIDTDTLLAGTAKLSDAGLVTNPTLQFGAGLDSGIFVPATDTLGFVINDIEIFRLTSTGITGLAYTAYTPTLAGITIGNGTINGRYIRLGDRVMGRVTITFGSTTTMSGTVTVALPFDNDSNYGTNHPIGRCFFSDANSTDYIGTFLLGTNVGNVNVINATATYAYNSGSISSTVPFTWASTDQILIQFEYEAA